uniref:GNAT family N-acetyltransferase n=1 Tax=Roseburia inulinivorans TaxID=360807 RepID=UPI004025AE5F
MVTDYSDVKLETKDLILKKAEFEDWKTIYYNLWRHKESAKYMLWQPTETDEDAKDRMKRTIAFEEKPENKYALFVYLKNTGEAIGFAGKRALDPGSYEETG